MNTEVVGSLCDYAVVQTATLRVDQVPAQVASVLCRVLRAHYMLFIVLGPLGEMKPRQP